MEFKLKKRHKNAITQTGRWLVFAFSGLAMVLSVVEASAHETKDLIAKNPEIGKHSQLVQVGYLPF